MNLRKIVCLGIIILLAIFLVKITVSVAVLISGPELITF
jgi:hypothetical protein